MAILPNLLKQQAREESERISLELLELEKVPIVFTPFKAATVFVPLKQGKGEIKPRSFRKYRPAGRQAGFNHGRKVTYYD